MKKAGVILAACLLLGLATPIYAQVYNPANGHYYELVTTEGGWTWYDARDAAASMTYNGMQGHLATITSSEENDFIVNEWPDLGQDFEFWIGGTDEVSEDDWLWITGETWSYTNWGDGEPNNQGNEDCLNYKYVESPPQWNDASCDSEFSYLVEYEPAIDLIISYLPTATAGKVGSLIRRLSVKYRVMNQGTANAVASELDFYLSRDTALSADDVYAGTVNIPALAPGAQAPLPYGIANFLLPVPAPAVGTWRVLGVADANGDNAESDETNNVVSTGAVVMGR